MKDTVNENQSIHHSIKINSSPVLLYRAITSQTELRKWWAPRVINSRGIIAYNEGNEIEMRLVQQETNRMVRYSWRPTTWPENFPETTITFIIEDCGVSRNKTGEGVRLLVLHDGWVDENEKIEQEKTWQQALLAIKNYLEGKKFKIWWSTEIDESKFQMIKFPALKQFLDKIDKDNKGKPEKKLASKNIYDLCRNIEEQGQWYMKGESSEVEFRNGERKIFSILKNGNIQFCWRELETLLGKKTFQFLTNRLSLEQNIDIHIGKSQDKIPGHLLIVESLTQWLIDVIHQCGDN